jgi:hypothetical protein
MSLNDEAAASISHVEEKFHHAVLILFARKVLCVGTSVNYFLFTTRYLILPSTSILLGRCLVAHGRGRQPDSVKLAICSARSLHVAVVTTSFVASCKRR